KIATGKIIPLKREYTKLKLEEILKIPIEKRGELYCWDFEKERAIKGFPDWESINGTLDKAKHTANEIILKYELRGVPLTLELFKNSFTRPTGTNNFRDYFTQELERRKNLLSNNTYRGYKATISKIVKFKPNLTLGGINYKFLV